MSAAPKITAANVRPTPIFVSPLMSLYWFFDANIVIEHSLIVDLLKNSYKKMDAFQIYWGQSFKRRPGRNIPY